MDPKIDFFLVVEGAVDRVVLEGLIQRRLLRIPKERIYPKRNEPKRSESGRIDPTNKFIERGRTTAQRIEEPVASGKDAAIEFVGSLIKNVKSSLPASRRKIALILDLDEHQNPADLRDEVFPRIFGADIPKVQKKELPSFPGFYIAEFENNKLLLMYAGIPGWVFRVGKHAFPLKKAMIEDCLLRLLLQKEMFEALKKRYYSTTHPYARIRQKFAEILILLQQQGMGVTSSKQALDIWKALVGFRVSPATVAEHVLNKAPERLVKAAFGKWIDALHGFFEPAST